MAWNHPIRFSTLSRRIITSLFPLVLSASLVLFTPITGLRGTAPSRPRQIGILFQSDNNNIFSYEPTFHEVLALVNRNLRPQAGFRLAGKVLPSKNRTNIALDTFCSLMEKFTIDIVIGFGSQSTLNTLSLVTNYAKLPTLVYNTDVTHIKVKSTHSMALSLNPSPAHLAKGLVRILEGNSWYYASTIISESYAMDGFLDTFKQLTTTDKKWKVEDKIRIFKSDTDTVIETKLTELLENKSRVIIIHCDIETAKKVFRVAQMINIVGKGYAWITTEDMLTTNPEILQYYPQGILTVTNDYSFDFRELMFDALSLLASAVNRMFVDKIYDSVSTGRNCWTHPTEEQENFSSTLYRYIKHTSVIGRNGKLSFDDDAYREQASFNIYNLIEQKKTKSWKRIGWFRNDTFDVTTIVWPGDTLSGPITNGSRVLRVVTNIVEPFVMEQSPNHGKCITAFPCLRVYTNDKLVLDDIFRDFEKGVTNTTRPYTLRCCQGLSIMLLDKLARDLRFRYQLYIVADSSYGYIVNDTWNGLVGDLVSGAAHLAVAAFSITSSRSNVIDYSTPYFYSGFSILVAERERQIPLHAFLEPFDGWLWFGIVIAATITAISMAIYEWNSPFGLNPWGRKRKTNYTLGSSLNMVYAILFQHTIKTKSPKAWPSKVLQNFWAIGSIIIYSSYTANLAAFLAGKSTSVTVQGIHDPKLVYTGTRATTVGVIEGTAIENYVRMVQPRLVASAKRYPQIPISVAIEELINNKNNSIDAYLDDTPILEYARATMDNTCVLKLVGQGFGDDGYGIGMQKNSWLKRPISQKILQYHESGFIEDLKDVFFIRGHCDRPGSSSQLSGEAHSMKFAQHAGLYLMMGVAVLLCVVLMFIEHAVFKWLVPYWRRKPGKSFWKTQSMMFWSQRLYRIITSEELVSPHTSAKEMMEDVRNRDFTKLFQKSVKKQEKQARNRKNLFNVVEQMQWKQRRDDRLHAEASLQEQDPPQDCDNTAPLMAGNETTPASAPPVARSTDKSTELNDDWPSNWRREWIGGEEEGLLKSTNKKMPFQRNTAVAEPVSSLYKNCHINASFSSQEDLYRNDTHPRPDPSQYSDTGFSGYKYTDNNRDFHQEFPLQLRERTGSSDSMESLYSQGDPRTTNSVAFIEGASGGHCYYRLPQEYLPNGDVLSRGNRPLSVAYQVQPKMQAVSNLKNITAHLPQSHKTLPLKDNRVKSNLLSKSRNLDATGYITNDITASLDDFTKEEILEMWQDSERELMKRLNQTANEKRQLEQRLARMTPFTDV